MLLQSEQSIQEIAIDCGFINISHFNRVFKNLVGKSPMEYKKEVRNNMDLKDIVTEEFQQEIQESFAYATGFGVVFIDKEGNHIGEGSNFTDFCKQINCTEEGAKCCARSNCRSKYCVKNAETKYLYLPCGTGQYRDSSDL